MSFPPFLALVIACLSTVASATDVLSYHYDKQSSGVDGTEKQLTPANLTVKGFAKRFTVPVDGQVYAQPLYKAGVTVVGGPAAGKHNLVLVATQHDSVYGIDADSGAVVWHTSFLAKGIIGATAIEPMPSGDTGSGDISPEIGVCGTPVIDGTKDWLYVAAKTKQTVGSASHYVYTLYKLNIANGNATANANILTSHVIADTISDGSNYTYRTSSSAASTAQDPFVFGTGDGAITVSGSSRVYFNAHRQMNRPGLMLVNGQVYVSFASHGDNGPYHGWILRFDASTLALTAALNTTPNGGLGGIWQAGGINVMDASGNFYFETGNGSFDGTSDGAGGTTGLVTTGVRKGFPVSGNYGDCFIKVSLDASTTQASQNQNGWGLKVADYFAPFNNQDLNNADADLGSGGCTLLPDSAGSAAHKHLLVGAGKEGKIYLVDRDNMGKFDANTDHVVQEQGSAIGSSFSTPAFFNGKLYWFGAGDNGKAYTVVNGAFSTSPVLSTADGHDWPGCTPTISANGVNNAILWALDRGSSQLRAYDPGLLGSPIWTTALAPNNRDQYGPAVKFAAPTVADGHVFTGTGNSIILYGPPVPPTAAPAAPSDLAGAAISGIEIDLSWTDNATNEDGFSVEQSLDGTNFTEIATLGVNASSYAVTGLQVATTYYFRVRAFNSFNTQSYSDYSTAIAKKTGAQLPTMDFSNGFLGSTALLNFNGSAKLNATSAELTDGGGSEAGTVWSRDKQSINSFTTSFRFQLTNADADGFTFAIQNSSSTALGSLGGSLGYETINYSIALKFDLYPSLSTTGLYKNGAAPVEDSNAINIASDGLDLHSGDPFDVLISYDGTTLTEKITDVTTSATHTYTYTIDIPTTVGGSTAYVGFTGGTGGLTATQDILSWAFTATPDTAPTAPADLVATPASGTQINLTWTDTSLIESGFIIERKAGAAGTWGQVGVTGANITQFFDTALAPDTDFVYRVRATNTKGDSGDSNEATAHTPVQPHTPTGAHTTLVSSSEISLAWTDEANNEDGYKILRKTTTGSNFAVIGTLPPDSVSYDDKTVQPGLTYDYHIQAYNLAGYSDFTGLTIKTLSKVTIAATDPTAQENTADTGTFIISRKGDASAALAVPYTVATGAGQAAQGVRYTVSHTSPVTIPAGATSVALTVIPLKDPALPGPQTVTISLDASVAYDTGPTGGATVVLNESPVTFWKILPAPAAILAREGDSVSFSVSPPAVGTLSYQWRRNGVAVSGATNSSITLTASLLNAGTYTVLIKEGSSSVVSGGAALSVVSKVSKTYTQAAGTSVQMPVLMAAAAGQTFAYDWLKNGASVSGTRVSGTTGPRLSITKLVAGGGGDSDAYQCDVTGAGSTVRTGDQVLRVFDSAPLFTLPLPMPGDAIVAGDYTLSLPVDGAIERTPTSYSASGLPPGLKIDSFTGIITGRPTIASPAGKPYQVTVKVSNAVGHDSATVPVVVRGLPATVVGTFNGLSEREVTLNGAPGSLNGLGGKLAVTVANTGAFTGVLTQGTASYRLAGTLTASLGGDPVAALALARRAPLHALNLNFSIDQASGQLTGTVDDGGMPLHHASLTAWHGGSGGTLAGTYACKLEISDAGLVGNALYPQGDGFGTLTLSPAGAVVWSGRMADGTSVALSSTVGPDGEIAMHQLLYTSTGSTQGWVQAKAGGLLDGMPGLDWLKDPQPSKSSDRTYKAGIPLHGLDATGAKVVPAALGSVMQGLSIAKDQVDNGRLTFTEGGLGTTTQGNGFVQSPHVLTNNTVQMPVGSVATLSVDAKTGAMSGTLNAVDGTTSAKRGAAFTGLVVPRLHQGIGYFLLPAGNSMSPILSGKVVLDAAP